MAAAMKRRFVRLLLLGLVMPAACAHARDVPPAYQFAARQAGVPASVLYAIALQESGARFNKNRLAPWPWTLNVAGRAERYATYRDACAGLYRALSRAPAKRIDAGLGQINLGYHAHRYEAPCELLDPYRNLAIAAEILKEHHAPGEDWLLAIGRYHRPAGGVLADRYRQNVSRHLRRLSGKTLSLSLSSSPLPSSSESSSRS
jgi:hypothetical protein